MASGGGCETQHNCCARHIFYHQYHDDGIAKLTDNSSSSSVKNDAVVFDLKKSLSPGSSQTASSEDQKPLKL